MTKMEKRMSNKENKKERAEGNKKRCLAMGHKYF